MLVMRAFCSYNTCMEWNDRFMTLFREAAERYLVNPHAGTEHLLLPDEIEFLGTIGLRAEDMHHFIADYCTQGAPSPTTALLVAAQRRSFFLTTLRGISGNAAEVKAASLPPETEEFQEIPYLPRLARKAEAVLFGTLDKTLMYPDAKDREFLQSHGAIPAADFLALVSASRGDRQKIVSAVLTAMSHSPSPAAPAAPTPQQGELPLS